MRLLEPWEELKDKEEDLRSKVNSLTEEKKKAFYKRQVRELKDPDTYAVLNWLFLGGFHHIYLKRYKVFAIEFTLLVGSIIGLSLGYRWPALLIVGLVVYELPQLFFSQKIARQYNYDTSSQILNDVQKSG
ncbi:MULTISPECIES: hypothetical protein [Vibrio]|uniref:TM2 domain-containing protein n=1 Tax=Vibrio proteolyticus NBRC 13287 TaxID=1219065 RepID=U3A126_VIBPR|nr:MULTISPECIES: hypothetical protein [Vibrio]NAW58873.1 hypothetical protein [Vibrio sp. V36_P2S2PM302]NAX27337.1 hypothetical protein [Vibrio sp. V38_P2S17PM301]NAX29451.1 hypothetical protein [Vibrio sp. V37_P2S8PM304]GAD67385.1 hypothetical protein VPR01S_07_01840 [Vibrio proteolyticus NBRC 13287]